MIQPIDIIRDRYLGISADYLSLVGARPGRRASQSGKSGGRRQGRCAV